MNERETLVIRQSVVVVKGIVRRPKDARIASCFAAA
jgi:hypothetical protein